MKEKRTISYGIVQTVHMIDSRLKVLRVVAAQGTVTAAAEAMNFSPSAVSHQLRTLSRDVGLPLVEQVGRGIRLTPAARILLDHADELYALWEEIRGELDSTDPEQVRSLRMCGFSTAASALLPHAAAQVRKSHPHCAVRIIEADPDECFELLLADQADLAVVISTETIPPRSDARFDQKPLLDDLLDLLVPADHPLAGKASVRLSDAAEEPWIMDRPGRTYRELVSTACAAAGFAPDVAHELSEWDTGAAVVAAGLAVLLIPRLARLADDDRIARVPLRGDPIPARHILTSVRRGSRGQPAIATALAALERIAAERMEPL